MYGEASVQESFHAAETLKLLSFNEFDFVASKYSPDKAQRRKLRISKTPACQTRLVAVCLPSRLPLSSTLRTSARRAAAACGDAFSVLLQSRVSSAQYSAEPSKSS